MKPTHQQLLQAVRKAGQQAESFTCADVRGHLGISTEDRRQLSQFHRSFRAFQDASPEEIEKVGPNRYRRRKRKVLARGGSDPIVRSVVIDSAESQASSEAVVAVLQMSEPFEKLSSQVEETTPGEPEAHVFPEASVPAAAEETATTEDQGAQLQAALADEVMEVSDLELGELSEEPAPQASMDLPAGLPPLLAAVELAAPVMSLQAALSTPIESDDEVLAAPVAGAWSTIPVALETPADRSEDLTAREAGAAVAEQVLPEAFAAVEPEASTGAVAPAATTGGPRTRMHAMGRWFRRLFGGASARPGADVGPAAKV